MHFQDDGWEIQIFHILRFGMKFARRENEINLTVCLKTKQMTKVIKQRCFNLAE